MTRAENTPLSGWNARVIAFYLPQYHPIPENDEWWGKGFTEWTNVAKAKPLFRGHHQPNTPADLGFYDLRLPEIREAQAELARAHGIEAFCYWHYWFAGRRILQRPFQEVLESKRPDLPFCLGWANETWTGIWHGNPDKVLIRQTYPGLEDYRAHFRSLLPAFTDARYFTVQGRPLFYVFKPHKLPDAREFTDTWRELALEAGLPGLYLVGHSPYRWDPHRFGFDAVEDSALPEVIEKRPWTRPHRRLRWELKRLTGRPTVYRYEDVYNSFIEETANRSTGVTRHPCILPRWDNTPRSGVNGLVLRGSTPDLFARQIRLALQQINTTPREHRLLFLKSWNEWAEGNYVEPDQRFGRAYLEVLRQELIHPAGVRRPERVEMETAADADPRRSDTLARTRA